MATFPFLPKDQDSSSSKITVKRSPRTLTMDDIAAEIAPQFPEHSPKEIREVLRLINNEIINTLLSGKDIEMADGSIYSLDMDGRTIIVYPPKDKP